ncbi:lycopene cyclase family protein [Psychroserpens sp. XS_ASV72]|uniref:lycopene cyclase family protein n=1 Tax=Psychroserpens sp. XS_ASV72 TaxID=3241293 RepID=UPI003512A085
MSDITHFDYIIVGNGLAGLQLALKFASDEAFKDKSFALIDPSEKTENDKTWSFWSTNPNPWKSIIHKSWNSAEILTSENSIQLQLRPYAYNSIRSIDFYTEATSKLKQLSNFHFILDEVDAISKDSTVQVKAKHNTYTTTHVFDSRIPEAFYSEENSKISLIQHFKGWIVSTETDTFDDSRVTMMDYRLKDGNQTTFMYVLPFSKREALVEFTYFTEHTVSESTYDDYIKQYITEILKIDNYSIKETEMGQIPMTNFNFSKFNTEKITKIGTGGGWVKGSTGYSFRLTEKKVAQIIQNIKAKKLPSAGLFKSKYRFYDKVFLKVLKDDNHKGEWVFKQFYGKNKIETMFRFLDEESTLLEDIKIMSSLFSWAFIKAFFKTL